MKLAKYFILLILLLGAAVSVFVATKDGKYSIKKNIIINVPQKNVFEFLSDSKSWETINPWKNQQTTSKSLVIIDKSTLQQKITIGKNTYKITIFVNDTLSKKTNLTLFTVGNLSFTDKLLNILNKGKDNNLGEKFVVGLKYVNEILSNEFNKFSIKIDELVDRDTIFYIQKVIACKTIDLPVRVQETLPKLTKLLFNTNTLTNGSPFLVYHSKDSVLDKIIFSVAIPTKHKVFTTPESDIFTGQINPYQAVKATLKGNYIHKKQAYKELEAFMVKNNLQKSLNNKTIEILKKHSGNTKLASQWQTEIYISIKPKIKIKPKKIVVKDSLKNETINTIETTNP